MYIYIGKKAEGRKAEMAICREGLALMLSPAAPPQAYCFTVPIRGGREAIWTESRLGPGQCTLALTCSIKPEAGESMQSGPLLAQSPAADTITSLLSLICALLLCLKWLPVAMTVVVNNREAEARGPSFQTMKWQELLLSPSIINLFVFTCDMETEFKDRVGIWAYLFEIPVLDSIKSFHKIVNK